jgi:hypothetical protein
MVSVLIVGIKGCVSKYPRAGGRIFETGDEDFLKLKTTGELGQGE